MSSADTDTEATAPATDERRAAIVAAVQAKLGDGVVASHVQPGLDAWVRVTRDAWADTAQALHDLGFTLFDYLSCIDWLPLVHGKNEEPPTNPLVIPATSAELDHGVTGGETRFQLIARLYSPEQKLGLHLKCDLPDDDLHAPTWSKIYFGADWNEREVWEMYGVDFPGHHNLIHLYLPGGFEGHPGRKDFPLLARHVKPWPGLVDVEAMPGEPDEDAMSDTEGASEEAADGEEAAE
ncbi:MAG: NADH-quinone oxidoreductase subunit C [Acidimicrobiia bacterium]